LHPDLSAAPLNPTWKPGEAVATVSRGPGMSTALIAAFDSVVLSDTLPSLEAFLALGRELNDSRLNDFIDDSIVGQSTTKGCLRGLLYAAARHHDARIDAETHARVDDEGHVRKLLTMTSETANWLRLRDELRKFYKAVLEELGRRSLPSPTSGAGALTSSKITPEMGEYEKMIRERLESARKKQQAARISPIQLNQNPGPPIRLHADPSTDPPRQTAQKALRDKKTEARDKWIYLQCYKGTPHDMIVAELRKIAPKRKWRIVSTKQRIRQIGIEYADRHGLPHPPPRQNK
jgi:hypothetical protein